VLTATDKLPSAIAYQHQILFNYQENAMSFENVSPQMERRFQILDEMVEKGYIEPVKPLQSWLPTLCFSPPKTTKFPDAPLELKEEFDRMFSWYAFFFAICAFLQTKLEIDYLKFITITIVIAAFLPASIIDSILGLAINIFMGKVFIFSRYYQYKNYGRCPSNRSIFSTICLSLIYLFGMTLFIGVVQVILYPVP
jgi:hypothetical protein